MRSYPLDDIAPTLASIANALAHEGIGATAGYAEEIRTIAQLLRRLYPEWSEERVMFTAIISVHSLTFGVCAAEDRQRTVEARAEKHIELARKCTEASAKSDKPKFH